MSDQSHPAPRAALWAWAPLVLLAGLALWLFAFGGMESLSLRAIAGQREAQTALAGGLRGLKAGHPGAFLGLMSVCFAYGFFHAAGPGHGKVLIGGLGLAGRGTARRLAGLALVSSLGQAVTAVALAAIGLSLLDWTRERLTGLAETLFAPLSWAAILGVGLWLVLRATRRLRRLAAPPAAHVHDHAHDEECGHSHGPTAEQAARATTFRESAALVAAIAMRPCTGALFLLIITHAMGLFPAGVAGTFVMALGTASVTVLVALLTRHAHAAALSRFAGLAGSATVARAAALIEGAAGALIAAVALSLLLPLI
ncbi:nickel/cobalt transporter [Pseudooceanicola sp.]|uniref:nickel/cobalt transporter n=1 Tax=Pseudooceanicola sp. TaxID=1914328 RepID=UPI00405992BA